MCNAKEVGVIKATKLIMILITVVSVTLELFCYLSIETAVACLMMVVCHYAFSKYAFKRYYIKNYPFSFIVLVSMFAYRYLPVPATLISSRPVTYGMMMPVKTFISESAFFLVFIIIFKISCSNFRKSTFRGIYKKIGLFEEIKECTIWIVGGVGLAIRILSFFTKGGAVNAITNVFLDYMYSPVILFFPFLYKKHYVKEVDFKRRSVWLYLIVLTICNLGSNSREDIITPFVIMALAYYIHLVVHNINVLKLLNPKRAMAMAIIVVLLFGGIQSISDAMLAVRAYRHDLSIIDLIKITANYASNSKEINIDDSDEKQDEPTDYARGWTEEYIDNFLLNRYGNIRISDEVFYMSENLDGYKRKELRKDLANRLLGLLPQPVINALELDIDKSSIQYSAGDYFYYLSGYGNKYSLGGRRVTSYLPDGLATFGIGYIFLHMICFFCLFVLTKGLALEDSNEPIRYSLFGILSLVSFHNLGMNSNGIYSIITFLCRIFVEKLLVYLLLFISINRLVALLQHNKS